MEKKQIYIIFLSLFFALLIAPFTPFLDLSISHFFFNEGHFVSNAFTSFLYKYGEALGFLVGGASSLALLASFFIKKLKPLQKGAALLSLTWILGAGLLINTLLKDHWGRPRPKQVIEFGGKVEFRPFYLPDFKAKEPQKSFPSGHASTGFYYFALALVGIRYRIKWLTILGLLMALGIGSLLSITRIAQGGHFFSDTLFSALLMGWVALFIDWLIFNVIISFKIKEIL